MDIHKIEDLVVSGSTIEAFNQMLKNNLTPEDRNELNVLKASFLELESSHRTNTITFSEYTVVKNKINDSLLKVLNSNKILDFPDTNNVEIKPASIEADKDELWNKIVKRAKNPLYVIIGLLVLMLFILLESSNSFKGIPEEPISEENPQIDITGTDSVPELTSINNSLSEIPQNIDEVVQALKKRYANVGNPINNRIRVLGGGKYGFTDFKGNLIIKCRYEKAGEFESEKAIVVKEGTYYIIDIYGTIVSKVDSKYQIINDGFNEGLTRIRDRKLDKIGFLDTLGKVAVDPIYETTGSFNIGRARALLYGKWGFIDKKGQPITEFKYDDCWRFVNGYALVSINSSNGHFGSLWGFINLDGEEIIPLEFDAAFDFSDGYSLVYKHPKFYFIEYSGNYALNAFSKEFDGATVFREGLAQVVVGSDTFCLDVDLITQKCPEYRYGHIKDIDYLKSIYKDPSDRN